ncbi:MAG TPA: phytanoyl-CoA dioxygenase family protein [Pyrinomonadaceae bacterium]|nr:phytanoyl-CoA dioxygenase family protein [Pyrinomonadaceae bacterium]
MGNERQRDMVEGNGPPIVYFGSYAERETKAGGVSETDLINNFVADGFLVVRGAVAPEVVRECRSVIENELRALSVDTNDPTTWTSPVVRIPCPDSPAFTAAGTSPELWRMYDALLGPGSWVQRQGVGGTIPVRFPSTTDPGDAGWHIDGSYDVDGQYWVNVHSRYRGLLALFLFSDISDDDAPTEIIVGSHLDIPRILAPYGERGVFFGDAVKEIPAATFQRPRARATGNAGDVYICHPFLVHRATWPHRGVGPRMIAQPEVAHHQPFALRDEPGVCAVERAILCGLE